MCLRKKQSINNKEDSSDYYVTGVLGLQEVLREKMRRKLFALINLRGTSSATRKVMEFHEALIQVVFVMFSVYCSHIYRLTNIKSLRVYGLWAVAQEIIVRYIGKWICQAVCKMSYLATDGEKKKKLFSLVFPRRDDAAGGEDDQRLAKQVSSARRREARQVGHRHAAQGALPVHALHLLHQHLQDTLDLPTVLMTNLLPVGTNYSRPLTFASKNIQSIDYFNL